MILISLIYAHYWSLLVPITRSVNIGISEWKTAIVGTQDRLEVKKYGKNLIASKYRIKNLVEWMVEKQWNLLEENS
jgi:hypothetical protein